MQTCRRLLVRGALLEGESSKERARFAEGAVGGGREPGPEVLHRLPPVCLHQTLQQIHKHPPIQLHKVQQPSSLLTIQALRVGTLRPS